MLELKSAQTDVISSSSCHINISRRHLVPDWDSQGKGFHSWVLRAKTWGLSNTHVQSARSGSHRTGPGYGWGTESPKASGVSPVCTWDDSHVLPAALRTATLIRPGRASESPGGTLKSQIA